MPWIESHTVLLRHRKLRELARALRIRPVHLMGHLHALWHATLEQAEDGDISSWSDDFIAELADFSGDASKFVSLLRKHGWLDGGMIHDWLDYAGKFLTSRYSTGNRAKLVEIWKKHGRVYGCQPEANGKRTVSDRIPVAPTQPTNQPTITNQPTGPDPPGLAGSESESGGLALQLARLKDDPEDVRGLQVQSELSRLKINGSVMLELVRRKDITPQRITEAWKEICADEKAKDKRAVLVSRLRAGT